MIEKAQMPTNLLAAEFEKQPDGNYTCWCGDFRIYWTAMDVHETAHRLDHLEGRYGTRPVERVMGPSILGKKVRALLRAGQKIEAIRLMRKHTQLSLKEAYDKVESLQEEMQK